MGETDAVLCELAKMRRFDFSAVTAEIGKAHVIAGWSIHEKSRILGVLGSPHCVVGFYSNKNFRNSKPKRFKPSAGGGWVRSFLYDVWVYL